MEKIAVFGSAFNPPSLGHASVLSSLAHFDRVLLVPSLAHAWGKKMLDYEQRCDMVQLFIQDLALPNLELSRIEEALYQPDQSVTTYAVLQRLAIENPNSDLTFVVGPDNLFKFAQFYRAEEIAELWNVMACPERVKVRSTMIREHLAQGKAIKDLTTPSISAYLEENQVYRDD
ncbi:nicotinate-nicotinamide nucleotide adenylyltransferase [Vibrio sp. SCSIO 43136]|uniref:nicotinate-nicotinamide nucleotide adenylyltransferase n=1 Tax=Vibrio sp. SCSIO 43136 TaxID=2819101 RepID=UPI002075BF6B|nr:nicotinate-nicotinamide nucleotide adenylyltransferase [Vibrio sp. SCSIO 43136]USD68075.1 nicotinate-nicotinamide nucleotide adenylyltransferase [Vibrio sp. SCSIO 43136]